MGKSIDLTEKKRKDQERLAKATGSQEKTQFKIPPPPSGTFLPTGDPTSKNVPPIPVGTVVSGDGKRLTPEEEQELKRIGWKEGDPIATNSAHLIQQLKKIAVEENSQHGFPEDLPPVSAPKPVDINALSPKQQEENRKALLLLAEQEKAEEERKKQKATGQMSESVQKAVEQAQNATRPDEIRIVDDLPKAENKEHKPDVDTGLTQGAKICPHCGWDCSQPDDIKPSWKDKMIYQQAIVGRKQFTKDYELFGGQVIVAFRVLAPAELDALYAHIFQKDMQGTFHTPQHLYEYTRRMEMYIQLTRWSNHLGDLQEFPDGLSELTNPTAETFWKSDVEGIDFDHIERYMVEKIFNSTTVISALSLTFNEFRRFCAKMEAMAGNKSFWEATEEQS